ncbi:MAG: tripartite tricarboxylate transporter substrate binding protein [Burkholderiales bacterium]|nr:tripartite tricarboxylate transporter substrate binding protein [Burkholderiales bacterium]
MNPVALVSFGCVSALGMTTALAQSSYPERTVRIIVGYPAGTQIDTIARLLGPPLADSFAKQVIVDNVAGASGNIGAERLAKTVPDGYTVGLVNTAQTTINPSLYKVSYDATKDFAPISLVASAPFLIVVHSGLPVKGLADLVKLAQARPGEVTYASAGSGTGIHMTAEYFKSVARIDLMHVPYRAVAVAMPDLLSGRVMMTFSPIATSVPLVREGKLRALAVTSTRRNAATPETPTVSESGYPGFEAANWFGLVGPDKTPPAVVSRLHTTTTKALGLPDVRAKLTSLGVDVIGGSPDDLSALIKNEVPRWAKLIRERGIKAQ